MKRTQLRTEDREAGQALLACIDELPATDCAAANFHGIVASGYQLGHGSIEMRHRNDVGIGVDQDLRIGGRIEPVQNIANQRQRRNPEIPEIQDRAIQRSGLTEAAFVGIWAGWVFHADQVNVDIVKCSIMPRAEHPFARQSLGRAVLGIVRGEKVHSMAYSHGMAC